MGSLKGTHFNIYLPLTKNIAKLSPFIQTIENLYPFEREYLKLSPLKKRILINYLHLTKNIDKLSLFD